MATVADNLTSNFDVLDRTLESEMTLSMGPQHPSTHGVLRLDLRLDGELVVGCIPDIGYLHTGMEKLFEYKKYIKKKTLRFHRPDPIRSITTAFSDSFERSICANCDLHPRTLVF